ncbi:MAG: hypothetical protein OXH22_04295 [Chloroflexi bacterium]|nr:hypothetical protein [Chloroflexota bacterium]
MQSARTPSPHPSAFGGNSRATRLADAGRASGAVSLRGQFLVEAQLIEGFVNASL